MKNIIESGGGFLLVKYHSISQLLANIYRDYDWIPSKFLSGDVDIWNNEQSAKYLVEWLRNRTSTKELSYLNKIITNKDGQHRDNILARSLYEEYPQYYWGYKFSARDPYVKKSQFMLKECLKSIFPGEGKMND